MNTEREEGNPRGKQQQGSPSSLYDWLLTTGWGISDVNISDVNINEMFPLSYIGTFIVTTSWR